MEAIKDIPARTAWTEYERRKAEIVRMMNDDFDPKQYQQKIKELAEELGV